MPGGYKDENYLDLSGETLSESPQHKQGDMLSSGLSGMVTSSTGEFFSDQSSGSAQSKSYRRRARRKAAVEAAKFHVPGSVFSAPAPADAATKQAITTSGSVVLRKDTVLLPGFSPGMVCQMDGGNGSHGFSQVDHLSWDPADIVECKYSTLTPTRNPTTKLPMVDRASETSTQNSNFLDRESKLGLEDSFDSVDGLCSITPLQPTRSSIYTTPILGSRPQGGASDILKTSSMQFSLMDSGKSETVVLTHALGLGTIGSTAQSLGPSSPVATPPEATEEVQRIARNRRIFGWVDGIISSPVDTPESISTTSPSTPLLVSSPTEDFLDFLDSDLLIDGSSPSNSASPSSVSSCQFAICHPDRISLLDLDDAGITALRGLEHCTISAISASSTSDLLLLDFEDGVSDPTSTKDVNPPLLHPQESLPTSASCLPASTSINSIPPPVGDAGWGKSTSKELQHKPTVVKVIVSAPKEAREVSPPIQGPIISAAKGSNGEVGNAAWNRWVEENSKPTPGLSLSRNTQRLSLRHRNTRGWPLSAQKSGRGTMHPNTSLHPMGGPNRGNSTDIRGLRDRASDPQGWNNYAHFNGPGVSLFKGQVKQMVECHQGYPACAVPTPVGKLAPTHDATKVAPVTWAGSGLPFEGLASRWGTTPQVTLGYHNPQTVSYKRTSAFNREQKVHEQKIFGKRSIHHRPKDFKTFPTKRDVWASQEADFMRCSGP
ncbi:hypothetical protein HOY82DRAFT_593041 [Tuber indicum]|nr:hypothetical protein HOY82DRAFT_593041 [Tuber indicum]